MTWSARSTPGASARTSSSRLNVVHITLPPLRQRPEDIPLLVDHLVQRLNPKLGTTFVGADRAALSILSAQPWKGNVRELENTLERAMLLSEDDVIRARHLAMDAAAESTRPTALRDAVRDFVRRHILEVLQTCDDDKRAAAAPRHQPRVALSQARPRQRAVRRE